MVIRAKLSTKGLLCCPCKAGSHTPQARHPPKAQAAASSHTETRQESCSNLTKLGELLFGFDDTMDLLVQRERRIDGFYDILHGFR